MEMIRKWFENILAYDPHISFSKWGICVDRRGVCTRIRWRGYWTPFYKVVPRTGGYVSAK